MISRKTYIKSAIAALTGASMLTLSLSQASALTLVAPTELPAAVQVELVGFHGYGGWHQGGGYHGGYWGHGYWGHGYWGSGYWGHRYPPYFPPRPCSIFGGTLHCPPV